MLFRIEQIVSHELNGFRFLNLDVLPFADFFHEVLMRKFAQQLPSLRVVHDQHVIALCNVVGYTCERPPTVQAALSIQQFADNLAIADDEDGTEASLERDQTAILFGPFGKSNPHVRSNWGGFLMGKQHLK